MKSFICSLLGHDPWRSCNGESGIRYEIPMPVVLFNLLEDKEVQVEIFYCRRCQKLYGQNHVNSDRGIL